METNITTFATQAVLSAFIPWVMEKMKDSKLPILAFWNAHTDLRNIATSFLAALAGVGFATTFSGTLESGGQLTVVIPSMKDWMSVLAMWTLGFFQQEAAYRMLFKQKKF
jgi:hypothetical protein